MIKRLLQLFKIDSDFTKNVAKVFSGSAIATVISIVTLPIITRLFTPDDYGLYQLLLSFIAIFISISSLKYEMAIVLPTKKDVSKRVFQLSLIILLLTTFLFSILLYFAGGLIFDLLNAERLQPYVIYIALGIFLGGLIEVLKYALISEKKFAQMASFRVAQASATQATAIGFGYLAPSFIGLFISHISGNLLHVILFLSKNKLPFKLHSYFKLKEVASEYIKFPTFNASSVFINNLAIQLPVFMFSIYFTPEIIGLYNVAYKCVNLPMNFLSSAVSQVYFSKAASAYQRSATELMKTYKTLLLKLSLFGLLPLVVVLFFAPFLTNLIFEDQWSEAGFYMQIIIFWVYFQFINASVGITLSVIKRQEYGLILISISLITRLLAMYFFRDSPEEMLITLTVTVSLFYILYNFMIYQLIKKEITLEKSI